MTQVGVVTYLTVGTPQLQAVNPAQRTNEIFLIKPPGQTYRPEIVPAYIAVETGRSITAQRSRNEVFYCPDRS